MGVLALLAVFTGGATADDGPSFAVVYCVCLLLGWLWYSVRRQDTADFRPATPPYIAAVHGSAVAVGVGALLPDGPRLGVWSLVVLCWLVGLIVLDRRRGLIRDTSVNASESLVERFDLFTIIVLGEVVGGIVDAGSGPSAVVTGILGLGIGFAYWWRYFDFVGARRVAPRRGALSIWLVGHLPVTMTVAATGGVIVLMIEHASDGHAPGPAPMAASASVSVSVGVLALVLVATSLADWHELPRVHRPVAAALALGGRGRPGVGLAGTADLAADPASDAGTGRRLALRYPHLVRENPSAHSVAMTPVTPVTPVTAVRHPCLSGHTWPKGPSAQRDRLTG